MNYTNYTISIKRIHRGMFLRKLRQTFIISRLFGLAYFLGRMGVLAAKITIAPFIFLAAVISWSLGIRDKFPAIRPISALLVIGLVASQSLYA